MGGSCVDATLRHYVITNLRVRSGVLKDARTMARGGQRHYEGMLCRVVGDFSNRIGSKAFLDLSEEASAEEVIEAYTHDHHLHELPKDGD